MRAYERLIRYAKIYTTSDPKSETFPSTARQLDLAKLLVEQFGIAGIDTVEEDLALFFGENA